MCPLVDRVRIPMLSVLLTALILCAGCVSPDSNKSIETVTRTNVSQQIAVGMDMAQVRSKLGDPVSSMTSGEGTTTWSYYHVTRSIDGKWLAVTFVGGYIPTDHKAKALAVYFDPTGKVTSYDFTENQKNY